MNGGVRIGGDGARFSGNMRMAPLRLEVRVTKRALTALVLLLAALAASAPAAAEPNWLVEIVYELDTAPLDLYPTPRDDPAADPRGYVIQPIGPTVPARLYAATGEAIPAPAEGGLWVATRFRNNLEGPAADAKQLEAVSQFPFAPDFATPSGIEPALSATLSSFDEGVATFGDIALARGDEAELATAERAVTREEFVDGILAAYAGLGIDEAPSRKAIEREAEAIFGPMDKITFHARIVAINHGPAEQVAADLAVAWAEAQRMAREGPYEDALAALETVLDALPEHPRAGRLFGQVLDLVEAGAVAALAKGRLAFPEGQPDEGLRAVWAVHGGGFVIFEPLGEAPAAGRVAAVIEEDGFTTYLPAGEYRVIVEVPGFAAAELEVSIEGETAFDVPLRLPD